MLLEDFKNEMNKIKESKFGVELYFYFNPYDIFRVNMTDTFLKSLIGDIKVKIKKLIYTDNMEFQPIDDIIDGIANTMYFIEGNLGELHFLNSDFKNCDTYDFSEKFPPLNKLKGFIFKVGNDQNTFISFRNHAQINLLSRKTWHNIYKSKQRFDEAPEDILRFTTNFDFMFMNNELLIFNLHLLENIFGYKDVILRKARTNITIIENSGLVTNTKLLYQSLDDSTLAKKLMRIKKDCPVLKLDNVKVIHFSKTNPKLKGLFHYSVGGKQIDISSKKEAKQFIKLLDDDFLHSQLTNLDYEAKVKIK